MMNLRVLPEEQLESTEIILDASWVLVVDSSLADRQAAIKQLGDSFNVRVAANYEEAREKLKKCRYNFVLIDLNFPIEHSAPITAETFVRHLDKVLPYGIFLLFDACNSGANCALIANNNYREDPLSAIFVCYVDKYLTISGRRAKFMHAELNEEGVKDWHHALFKLAGANLFYNR